jgi:hypothetical protein
MNQPNGVITLSKGGMKTFWLQVSMFLFFLIAPIIFGVAFGQSPKMIPAVLVVMFVCSAIASYIWCFYFAPKDYTGPR